MANLSIFNILKAFCINSINSSTFHGEFNDGTFERNKKKTKFKIFKSEFFGDWELDSNI